MNVKIIFENLIGCPAIEMSYIAYDTMFNEFFRKNANNSTSFDDFVYYLRKLPANVEVYFYDFLTWWKNNSTYRYYWPACKMSIFIDKRNDYDFVRIGGLIVDSCRSTCIPTSPLHIKDVIFNNPATIVFWSDGTKTVCTCSEEDMYDPEKGLALCCMKKLLYKNKGHIFNNARAKWLKKAKK